MNLLVGAAAVALLSLSLLSVAAAGSANTLYVRQFQNSSACLTEYNAVQVGTPVGVCISFGETSKKLASNAAQSQVTTTFYGSSDCSGPASGTGTTVDLDQCEEDSDGGYSLYYLGPQSVISSDYPFLSQTYTDSSCSSQSLVQTQVYSDQAKMHCHDGFFIGEDPQNKDSAFEISVYADNACQVALSTVQCPKSCTEQNGYFVKCGVYGGADGGLGAGIVILIVILVLGFAAGGAYAFVVYQRRGGAGGYSFTFGRGSSKPRDTQSDGTGGVYGTL